MPYHEKMSRAKRAKYVATVAIAWGVGAGISILSQFATATPRDATESTLGASSPSKGSLDRSGKVQVGKASFYASRYSGKTMADGTPMRLYSSNAASLTLPLGTTARVTNLDTGRSAVVTIRDRGPYVKGRIVDLSPATAREIGLARKQGLATVRVTPLTIPLPDGSVKIVPASG
jgi:rare lipoprotein A